MCERGGSHQYSARHNEFLDKSTGVPALCEDAIILTPPFMPTMSFAITTPEHVGAVTSDTVATIYS